MKEKKELLNGNEAAARSVVQCRVQVVSAYPITPQTDIVEDLSKMCEDGSLKAVYITTDSEHSAMANCIGASSKGVRVYTATSSQGMVHMCEMVHWASGARLPIVMSNVSRELCAPWALGAGFNDSMAMRDAGWIQLYCKNAQEVYDTIPMAYRLSEQTRIPAMQIHEGFTVSKAGEGVIISPQEYFDKFLPPYNPECKLDINNPIMFSGALLTSDAFMEIKERLHLDMMKVPGLARGIEKEFAQTFGRKCPMIIEKYKTSKAENIIISMGTICNTIKDVIDRNPGLGLGLIRIKMYRPFPESYLRKVLSIVGENSKASQPKKIIVIDRSFTPVHGGHVWGDIKAIYKNVNSAPGIFNYIVGLNGGNITPEMIMGMVKDAYRRKNDSKPTFWHSGGKR